MFLTRAEYENIFNVEHKAYVLRTYGAGSKDLEGVWNKGSVSLSTIIASYPQPVKMNELVQLNEGESVADYVRIYTTDPVFLRLGVLDGNQIEENPKKVYTITSIHNRVSHIRVIMKRVLT